MYTPTGPAWSMSSQTRASVTRSSRLPCIEGKGAGSVRVVTRLWMRQTHDVDCGRLVALLWLARHDSRVELIRREREREREKGG